MRLRRLDADGKGVPLVLSSSERSQRARLGALRLHATHDPKVTSAPGRAAFLAGFDAVHDCAMCGRVEIPADLPEHERLRRAEYAKRGHMAQLAYRSARLRSEKKRSRRAAKAEAA
jgi:hypothetical protein